MSKVMLIRTEGATSPAVADALAAAGITADVSQYNTDWRDDGVPEMARRLADLGAEWNQASVPVQPQTQTHESVSYHTAQARKSDPARTAR